MNLWNKLTTIFNFLSCIVYEIVPSILKSHTTKSVKLAFNEERAVWIRHNADSCGYSEDKDYERQKTRLLINFWNWQICNPFQNMDAVNI